MDEVSQPVTRRRRNLMVVAVLVVVWLAFDQAVKTWIDGAYAPGELVAGPFAGLVQFRLVHNTGMAWGLFSDSTVLLAVFSLLVVVALAVYLVWAAPRGNLVEMIGGALVLAGGLGNAIDRFVLGYVVDFIEAVFIDFPVFNIADIGVTCGVVLFVIGFTRHQNMLEAEEKAQKDALSDRPAPESVDSFDAAPQDATPSQAAPDPSAPEAPSFT